VLSWQCLHRRLLQQQTPAFGAGYPSPAAFEQGTSPSGNAAVRMGFIRHAEIQLSDVARGKPGMAFIPAHHWSESQLSIPFRRSSSPVPQPSSIFTRTAETVHNRSPNRTVQHRRLFHLFRAPQTVKPHPEPTFGYVPYLWALVHFLSTNRTCSIVCLTCPKSRENSFGMPPPFPCFTTLHCF
jgi:hypothetical protein